MANPPAGSLAPGITTTPDKYPQWGVGGGVPGNPAGWKVVEAKNAAQKQSYLGQGIDVWFSNEADAKTFMSSQQSAYGSGEPQNAPGIADFLGRLTQASTWLRVAEVLLGSALIIVALAKLASNTSVGRAATRAGKAAMIL